MLHSIPTPLLTSLTARIHESVQDGCIDVPALVALCRRHVPAGTPGDDPGNLAEPWTTRLLPWALQRTSNLPPDVPSIGIAPHTTSDAWPAPSNRSLLCAQVKPTAIIEAPLGLPDVVAIALAFTIVAHSGGHCPQVLVHPDLKDSACETLGKKRGRAILGLLAEMGLAARPWHLWVGPRAPVALLSPYVRDLGEALWLWGQRQALVGADLPFNMNTHMPELYALADAFVASHEGLAVERAEAERTVGITQARYFDLDVAVVDLGRVSESLWDPRLPSRSPWPQNNDRPAPVIICVPHAGASHDERTLGALVARLSQSLGATTQSITVCQPGLFREGKPHPMQVSSVLCAAGSWPLSGSSKLTGGPAGCVDAMPWSLDEALWENVDNAGNVSEEANDGAPLAAAATVGGGGLLWARILRLQHRGSLPQDVPLYFEVHHAKDGGEPDNVAVLFLQRLMVLTAAPPTSSSSTTRSIRGVRV